MIRGALRERVLDLIEAYGAGQTPPERPDVLLADIAAYQRDRVEPYARLWEARPRDRAPAMPTDVFRFARVSSFAPRHERRVFLTSGTTHGLRGRHAFRDLVLYDRAAEVAARHALFPDYERMRLVMLAPHPADAPESSLSYMLGRFEDWFGRATVWAWADGALSAEPLIAALDDAAAAGEPIAILGTAFAFVFAEDSLGDRRWRLPAGSRAMTTGGYKGRTRELTAEALRGAIEERYTIDGRFVVGEYGMTELSSQMYETSLMDALADRPRGARRLWVPGWVRVEAVDPERLEPVPPGEVGVLRIDDVANLDSVSAIQTADLGVVHRDGVELIGRAPGSVPRGCSLAVEEALREVP